MKKLFFGVVGVGLLLMGAIVLKGVRAQAISPANVKAGTSATTGKSSPTTPTIITNSVSPAPVPKPASGASTVMVPGTTDQAVTVNQLKDAGFSDVKPIAPQANRFLTPNLYFTVKESVANKDDEKAWGDVAHIVAVLVRPMKDKSWQYNKGLMEVINFTGRTQARISSAGGYYIVVTGPDKDKVVTLAHNLQVLH